MFFATRTLIFTAWLLQPVAVLAYTFSGGLEDAYLLALQHDAAYEAAYFDNQAGQQYKEIGRASLLPVISANYLKSKNKAKVKFENTQASRLENRDYDSEVGMLQFRMPLINFDAMAQYKLGKAQTLLSDQEFVIRTQELIMRVFNKYAAALYAEDVLALAVAQRESYAEQKKSNEKRYKYGEGTITDTLESQAKYDLAETEVIEAQDVLNNERSALSKVLGQEVLMLNHLADDFKVQPMLPASLDEWEAIALQQNAEINAERYGLDIAKENVKRRRAGYLPKLDMVASLNKRTSDTINSFNQTATTRSIGLQLTVPIYSGGSVTAYTSQAESNVRKARAALEGKINDVIIELQRQFNTVASSKRKLNALEIAVRSAALLVEATQKSIKGGTRTNFDALNAAQQLFEAKRDLALARYNYLQSYINLRKVAGTLNVSDLQKIATYFY